MAFNAQTYRANKYRKSAWRNLAQARDIQHRAELGNAYDWEIPRIKVFVELAKSDMKLYLMTRKQ